eukprot:TRINITY_DN1400_c0_g2_i1.p1 TRINITY_DN1400_c0_g2~~TRINITY_DN1400_c0_g2_i1.p1  ORF type:complete len:1474 (+),score=344.11 TRINITY_DN1400_c0_g2_i1:205-4626(+)
MSARGLPDLSGSLGSSSSNARPAGGSGGCVQGVRPPGELLLASVSVRVPGRRRCCTEDGMHGRTGHKIYDFAVRSSTTQDWRHADGHLSPDEVLPLADLGLEGLSPGGGPPDDEVESSYARAGANRLKKYCEKTNKRERRLRDFARGKQFPALVSSRLLPSYTARSDNAPEQEDDFAVPRVSTAKTKGAKRPTTLFTKQHSKTKLTDMSVPRHLLAPTVSLVFKRQAKKKPKPCLPFLPPGAQRHDFLQFEYIEDDYGSAEHAKREASRGAKDKWMTPGKAFKPSGAIVHSSSYVPLPPPPRRPTSGRPTSGRPRSGRPARPAAEPEETVVRVYRSMTPPPARRDSDDHSCSDGDSDESDSEDEDEEVCTSTTASPAKARGDDEEDAPDEERQPSPVTVSIQLPPGAIEGSPRSRQGSKSSVPEPESGRSSKQGGEAIVLHGLPEGQVVWTPVAADFSAETWSDDAAAASPASARPADAGAADETPSTAVLSPSSVDEMLSPSSAAELPSSAVLSPSSALLSPSPAALSGAEPSPEPSSPEPSPASNGERLSRSTSSLLMPDLEEDTTASDRPRRVSASLGDLRRHSLSSDATGGRRSSSKRVTLCDAPVYPEDEKDGFSSASDEDTVAHRRSLKKTVTLVLRELPSRKGSKEVSSRQGSRQASRQGSKESCLESCLRSESKRATWNGEKKRVSLFLDPAGTERRVRRSSTICASSSLGANDLSPAGSAMGSPSPRRASLDTAQRRLKRLGTTDLGSLSKGLGSPSPNLSPLCLSPTASPNAKGSGISIADQQEKEKRLQEQVEKAENDAWNIFRRVAANSQRNGIEKWDAPTALELMGVAKPDIGWCDEIFDSVDCQRIGVLTFDSFRDLYKTYVARQREEYKTAFRKFDTDNSGTIDSDELRSLLTHLGIEPMKYVLEEIASLVDEDKTGSLDIQEFENVMNILRERKGFSLEEYQEVQSLFERFEKTAKGQPGMMKVEQIQDAIHWLGLKVKPGELEEIVSAVDVNKSGYIDEREWMGCMRRIRDSMIEHLKEARTTADIDGGGTITYEELPGLMVALGYVPAETALREAFEQAGLSEDSHDLDLGDLWRMLREYRRRECLSAAELEEVDNYFQKFCPPGGGSEIPSGMMGKMCRSLGYTLDYNQQGEMVRQIDFDKSGTVSLTEFRKMIRMIKEKQLELCQLAFNIATDTVPAKPDGPFRREAAGRCTSIQQAHQAHLQINCKRLSLVNEACLILPEDCVADNCIDILGFVQAAERARKKARTAFLINGGFREDEVEDFRAKFDYYDEDRGGTIGGAEIARMVQLEFPHLYSNLRLRPQIIELMQEANADGSGCLSFGDFLRLMRHVLDMKESLGIDKELHAIAGTHFAPNEVDEFRELFRAAAADKDGSEIGFDEVNNLLSCIVPMGAKNTEILHKKFHQEAAKNMGVDGDDDEMDFPEFLWLMRGLIDMDFGNLQERTKAISEQSAS